MKRSLQARTGIALIVLAALLIEVTAAVQYWFAYRGIREEVKHRAESELKVKSLEIQRVLTSVEVAIENHVWNVERLLVYPDSLLGAVRCIVEENPQFAGAGIAFVPNYYPEKGYWYEPYAKRMDEGRIELSLIGKQEHDYTQSSFFTVPTNEDKSFWSEPYLDKDGAKMIVTSYAVPIHDSTGRTVAVLAADVSLDWLGDFLNAHHVYPSSYNTMISREGKLMACPVESLVMQKSIQEVTSGMEDTSVLNINRQMMSGKSGQSTVVDDEGNKNYVFYSPIEGGTGWSMAVVCSDKEIYRGLRQVGFNLMLLMIFGLALMSYILYRTINGFNRLQLVNAEKERIGSELRIARDIQMGMLPKIFPPYPDRDDVEIYGSLVPAKEVGGDLFDFYIRDEKLFFCIGDVSGKGVPASLVMAVTRSLFRTVSSHEAAPDRLVSRMNESMAEMNESNMFVTLFVGILDLPTGRLHYCNAGHCAPMLIGSGVGLLPVDSNIPVGLIPDWKYTAQQTLVNPQTTIFLYTDGLTEAEDVTHALFGEKRMLDVASQLRSKIRTTPDDIISCMSQSVHDFVKGNEQSDDLTMLALQYTKQQLEVRLKRTLKLPNDVNAIPQLSNFVESIAEELNFDDAVTMQLNLAMEEAIVNVMKYAYPAGTPGEIDIEAQANDVRLKFVISDSGIPFDPTAQKEVDTSLPVEDRPIGGLGIHLVRHLMDSINYERIEGKNVLTLRKKL